MICALLAIAAGEARANRLWGTGFESGTAPSVTEFQYVDAMSGGLLYSSAGTHGGLGALHAIARSGARSAVAATFDAAGLPTFVRAYLRVVAFPAVSTTILEAYTQGASPSPLSVKLSPTGALTLYAESMALSGQRQLAVGPWYRLEVEFDRSSGPGQHVLRARVDGVEFAGTATADLAYWVSAVGLGINVGSEANNRGEVVFDDVAVNDNVGGTENSYPGAGAYVNLRPGAAGQSNQWTNNSTGSPGLMNYARCAEDAPDDAATFVYTLATAPITDDYLLRGVLDPPGPIRLVMVGVRYAGAGALNGSFRLRLSDTASGPVISSPVIQAASAFWITNGSLAGQPSLNYNLVTALTPEGAPWTQSDLSAARVGIADADSLASEVRVSALWALVEYLPDGGAAPGSGADASVDAGLSVLSDGGLDAGADGGAPAGSDAGFEANAGAMPAADGGPGDVGTNAAVSYTVGCDCSTTALTSAPLLALSLVWWSTARKRARRVTQQHNQAPLALSGSSPDDVP